MLFNWLVVVFCLVPAEAIAVRPASRATAPMWRRTSSTSTPAPPIWRATAPMSAATSVPIWSWYQKISKECYLALACTQSGECAPLLLARAPSGEALFSFAVEGDRLPCEDLS